MADGPRRQQHGCCFQLHVESCFYVLERGLQKIHVFIWMRLVVKVEILDLNVYFQLDRGLSINSDSGLCVQCDELLVMFIVLCKSNNRLSRLDYLALMHILYY